MERETHDLTQGSPEWHTFRAEHDGASEAPAMLSLSKHTTRSQLLQQKSTGLSSEVDAATQALFDAGHATEAAARPLAEEIIGDELFPATCSYGRLSASCDGLTMDGTIAFEHKLYRAALASAVMRGELPDEYMAQCQQILLVTGAEQVLFVTSDGTRENWAHLFVKHDTDWQRRIVAGWEQFRADLVNYQYVEVIPAAVAAPTMQLPALSIQVTGAIALVDNLKVFGERLGDFIEGLDRNPSDDQSFANAEAAIKTLSSAEAALEAAKSSALAQTASIDEMTRTVALYAEQARSTRLMLEKLVKARKEAIRVEIRQGGIDALQAHIAALNQRLGKPYMPPVPADFAGAMKGKKTVASLRDAVDNELSRTKIAANEIADRIQVNLTTLQELAKDHAFLFHDTAQIALKAPDDMTTLVHHRINEHRQAEAKRLEAERERIRKEEAARLEAETAAKAKAEADELARKEQTTRTAPAPLIVPGSPTTTPAPIVTWAKPPIKLATSGRPSDGDIIGVLQAHYHVSRGTVLNWLCDLDAHSLNLRWEESDESAA